MNAVSSRGPALHYLEYRYLDRERIMVLSISDRHNFRLLPRADLVTLDHVPRKTTADAKVKTFTMIYLVVAEVIRPQAQDSKNC